ncbi:MAG: Ig-like domain-containing protein, partial [Spirochaetes bacterium]|nr:Ig-like domain-containing protein [Spirochaetota bacterium]
MRQYLLVVALLLAPLAAGWALGNPEAGDYKPVQGRENWDARLDIAGMKAGKYNLIVRGTDAAGNVRYEGPYNVFVDPASDLPVVHISHPTPGARVGTLLHVVGTCVDDDGVKAVMVQLDEQDPVPATGTEFWSFALDVAAVQDGEHTLTAKAIDINGTEGRAQSVRFQIDKKAPITRITSHPSGAVVTGQVTLDGEVEDANGVASLGVSRDGGKSWEPLKPSLDKPGRKGAFRVGLDTRKISDGPQVLSFKAVDRTGSISQFAFLLFVNNDAPVLEILSPADDAAVNGKVMVSGRASDKIGLKSLQYDLGGGEAGTIELAAGNPFWTQELDLSAKKAGTVQVTYTLENLTGNKQTRKLKLKVDPEKDRPQLTVSTPAKGERVTGVVMVSGIVRDDDAVERIEYSLDGGSPASLPAVSAFSFALGELAPGAHKLVLKPVDVNGIAGLPVETAFTKAGPPPSIAMD